MDKISSKLRSLIIKGAFTIAIFSANITCGFFFHQPKLPKTVKDLRNF